MLQLEEQLNSFIPADRALSMGRLLVPVIVLVIPAVGVLIGWVTYEAAGWHSQTIVLALALPTALIYVCSCYWMAYCLVGRIESKQRPTRTNGFRWPWDFHCTLIGLAFLFIMFAWYGLIIPATSGGNLDSTLISIHSILMLTTAVTLVWLQTTDPSAEPFAQHTEGEGMGCHQKCVTCTARMQSGLQGPWTGKLDQTGEVFYPHRRRYHCSRCNRCVYGLDHHCRFLNQCVTDQTYKQWLLFMLSLWSVVMLQFGMSITVLVYWYADWDKGSLRNLDSVTDFYSRGLYFTLIYLHILFCIGLIVFLSQLLILHIKLVHKSRSMPDRYTMFEHIRDHPPKGWSEKAKKSHVARMQWKDDVQDVQLSEEKQESMKKAFKHAQKTTGLYEDQEGSALSCWEQLKLDSVRALGADTSYDEDQFDPSGRASRVLASTIALMRSEQGLNTSAAIGAALTNWRKFTVFRKKKVASAQAGGDKVTNQGGTKGESDNLQTTTI